MPAHCVLILGVFRSGTSLTCRLLDRLGVDFGPPDALWRADQYNPGGFYERLDINDTNGRLIESAGGTLADPPDPPRVCHEADRTPLTELDLSWTKSPERWGLKDPRLCSTLTTWIETGRLDMTRLSVVYVRRDPDAVSRSVLRYPSLTQHVGIDPARVRAFVDRYEAMANWHVDRLVGPVLHVHYENLLDDPTGQVDRLADFVRQPDRRVRRQAAAEVGRRRAHLRFLAARIGRRLGVVGRASA